MLTNIKRKPVGKLAGHPFSGPRASTLSKCVPIILMLPPLLLSILLLLSQHRVILGSWRLYIHENLSAVSALRQVLAGILGTLQASAVIAILFNFPARTRLARSSQGVKLDTLGLLTALSVPRMDWNLPKKNWLLLLLAIVLGHGPAALWASAITPLPTTSTVTGGTILIPSFPEASEDQWGQRLGQSGTFSTDNCTVQMQTTSFITNCPIPYHQNSLINAAQDATALGGTPRNHSKPDNPTWTYQGRSFGVGSSIGFPSSISETPKDFQLNEYSFEETGYNASVTCDRVSPSDDKLHLKYKLNQAEVGIFRLTGNVGNTTGKAYSPVTAWCDRLCYENSKGEKHCREECEAPDRAIIFAWSAAGNDEGQFMVGIRAQSLYADDFDHIQCSIDFITTAFKVAVNATNTNNSITVTQSDGARPDPMGPDSTRTLLNQTVHSLRFLSKMSSNLYIALGRSNFA